MTRLAAALAWVLVALVGIALVAPKMIGKTETSRIEPAYLDESELAGAINSFKLDCGRCPTSTEGFRALIVAPKSVAKQWHGPYLQNPVLRDPWGHPYIYLYPGSSGLNSFSIISLGPSGQPGRDNIVDND